MSDKQDKYIIPKEIKPKIIEHFKSVGQRHDDLIALGYELLEDQEDSVGSHQDVSHQNQEDQILLAIELAITSDPDSSSTLDRGSYAIRYRYEGPRDSRNREFCAQVLDLDLVYRKEDINQMSFRTENRDFGTYSIFNYKGSYNCRHNWKRLVYKKTDNPVGNTDVEGYRNVPVNDLPSSYVPSDGAATSVNSPVR